MQNVYLYNYINYDILEFSHLTKGVEDMSESTGKAATRAKNKYNAQNYDSLRIVVPKGQKEELQTHAASMGESLNAFVNRAINTVMEQDKENAI